MRTKSGMPSQWEGSVANHRGHKLSCSSYTRYLQIVKHSARPVVAHAEQKVVFWHKHQSGDGKAVQVAPSPAEGHLGVRYPDINKECH